MMIENVQAKPDPNTDRQWIKLSNLPKYIPPGRNGKPRHTSSIYRYHLSGKGGICLVAKQLPDGLYTTLREWRRFVQRLTAAQGNHKAMALPQTTRKENRRQNAVEQEIAAMRSTLGRKA
jgi:hypothetical protein